VSRATAGLLLARVALLASVAIILWSSLAPAEDVPLATNVSDKVLHTAGYAVLGALAFLSVRQSRPLLVLLAVACFGLLLEILQRQTGYRSFEWTDLLADAIGAAVGIAAAMVVRGLLTRRRRG
jgi:VanZ family protein